MTASIKDKDIFKWSENMQIVLLRNCVSSYVFILLLLFLPKANAFYQSSSAYVGFDSYLRKSDMVSGFGEGIFDKNIPEYNLYVGYAFNQYFSLEGGQLFTQNVTRTSVSLADTIRFGGIIPPGAFEVAESKIGMHGSHINLLGRFPLKETKVSLLGSMGIVVLKVKATYNLIADDFGPLDLNDQIIPFRSFSSRRVIPRLMLGANYQITERLGIRFLVNYEFTSKFKNIAVKTLSETFSSNRLSFKNNALYGIGLTVAL